MRLDEVPVFFKYVDPTTVRMVNHGWSMIKDTLRLRRAMRRTGRPVVTECPSVVEPSAVM